MTYDVESIRAHFPALSAGTVHFDSPGGTQTPLGVGQAILDTLTGPLSIRGRRSLSERNADDAVTEFRSAMADLLGADPHGIVYGRSATQLTYDFSRHLARDWAPGDEIVVSRLDHDANIRPWLQAADRAGATVVWVDFDPETGELPASAVAAVLTARTRLVAVTAASNLIGTRPPIAEIAAVVHEAGALLFVDGVHYVPHTFVDLAVLGADFFVCSPYKFFGPHCGVLAADPALLAGIHPDKLLPSTDVVPERFELGTLPYETLAGVRAAVDFLAGLGELTTGVAARPSISRRALLRSSLKLAEAHEDSLRDRLESGLAALPGVTVYSRAVERTPTVLVGFAGRSAADATEFLFERGILAPSGSFYALEASRHLGLGEAGALRIGLAPYSTPGEIDVLLAAITDFVLR
ncbi:MULTISPECIES: cysteine desulfurase-like protein [Cryobacterium]|uniref:cysteine desulfurase-like protein n=1 Tax=Cryobacterium TaxID=69578 RepID=UPI000CD3DE95|nr:MULTISPECIES: cysteine desulfurase-like protein [Cryobacterium]POH67199.1 cysteine desulfurase-like protein [Cryobacterium zongtaii]TFC43894.1 cysteine desulfurase-like protein [Cryobacterium sp. TMN-39-2]